MSGLVIPDHILDAARQLRTWMYLNGITRVGDLCSHSDTDIMQHIDIIEEYEGKDGNRQWGNHGTWLYPDDAIAIINLTELRKLA